MAMPRDAAVRREVVVGVFRDWDAARDAISALKDRGFSGNEISVLTPNRDDTATLAEDTGTSAGTGAATGLVAGGILGGLAGWLVGIGSLVIPGVGPFIAVGAFASAISGAAIGAGVGVIAGALIGMGIPSEEADWYEQEVTGGGTLVAVRAGVRDDEAEQVLHQYGAYDIEHRDAAAYAATTSSLSPSYTTPGVTTVETGGASGTWDEYAPRYRRDWEQRYGTSSARWDEYEPRYRYGWEMANDPRYRGRPWADVEPDLRADYLGRYPGSTWDEVKDSIRGAWDSITGTRRP